ncbi:MAG: DUF2695 domain-containing protein [Pseudomonadota bacterium]
MAIRIKAEQLQSLVNELESRLEQSGCNHTLRFAMEWASNHHINKDDLLDVLEANGGHCDCEVTFNVVTDQDIVLEENWDCKLSDNPWRVPSSFQVREPEKAYSLFLVSRQNEKANCYAKDGELLLPAPKGAKPRKRIRRSVHFFLGLDSRDPNEIAFVEPREPLSAAKLAKTARDTGLPEYANFSDREAHFVLSKLERMKPGTPMGTHFMTVKDIGGPREELRVHKVILAKSR